MIENFHRKVLHGMMAAGSVMLEDKESVQRWPFILTGNFDEQIKCWLFYNEFKKEPESLAQLESENILILLERIKETIRGRIQYIFKMAEREEEIKEEREKEKKQQVILAELKTRNIPHEWGTVAEIAQRYNVSKSEVRRRKAEGTLNELLTINKKEE